MSERGVSSGAKVFMMVVRRSSAVCSVGATFCAASLRDEKSTENRDS
jgi:hypothetical protein